MQISPYQGAVKVTAVANDATAYTRIVPSMGCQDMLIRERAGTGTMLWTHGVVHKKADTTNAIAAAAMSDLATGYTLSTEFRTDLPAHMGSTTHHLVADAYTPTAPIADDEAKLVALTNELVDAYNAHLPRTDVHGGLAGTDLVVAPVATDEATAQDRLNDLRTKYALHIAKGDLGHYQTVPAGQALGHGSVAPLFVKLGANGTLEVAEWLSI